MTSEQSNEYWHKWHRFQQIKEKQFIPKIRRALNEQHEQYIATKTITSTPIYNVLTELYKTTGVQWAHKISLDLPRKKARLPMGFSERIVALMRQYYGIDLLNDAEGITATTREYIADVLSLAAEKGWGFDRIVSEIRDPTLNAKRARLIARTETVTAANGAASIYAKETGLPMNKTWIAVRDKRTRDSHRLIDNTVLDIDTPFTLIGEEGTTLMQQPGARKQPNGMATPGDQTINCRCTAAFTVKG